jgi:hypothetical protein
MMRLFYAGGSVLTSDAVAASVVEYAAALAKSQMADAVTLPVVDTTGQSESTAMMLLGPSSQLLCVPEPIDALIEPSADEFLTDLDRRTRFIASPRPITGEIDEHPAHDEYE